MNLFVRSVFFLISFCSGLIFMLSKELSFAETLIKGFGIGLGISGVAFFVEQMVLKKINLRTFNTVLLGLFVGYLFGLALTQIFEQTLSLAGWNHMQIASLSLYKIFLFQIAIYLALSVTLRKSNELSLSIPFVQLKGKLPVKKNILLDLSALSDPRIIDLAASGLIDKQLIVPRFVLNSIYEQIEDSNETIQNKAKRSLEIYKKLEQISDLAIRFSETDFSEIKDINEKMIRLARLNNANIITANMSRIEISNIKGTRIINLHNLSNALKPLMQGGERLEIKIQRLGKEPLQGVGYLEDGTMVVVNGGGHYIGKTIHVLVLSVKHTSSGRMIFCNVDEENSLNPEEQNLEYSGHETV